MISRPPYAKSLVELMIAGLQYSPSAGQNAAAALNLRPAGSGGLTASLPGHHQPDQRQGSGRDKQAAWRAAPASEHCTAERAVSKQKTEVN
jgi:hypothetical protein